MRIIIATGGSGGHIYPALALADEIKKEDNTIKYYIERTNGAFNSYGELLTEVIERG